MDVELDTVSDQVDRTLSVAEAAEHFNVSEKTIRRWIKSGTIKGVPMKTPQGYEWRIHPNSDSVQADVQIDNHVDSGDGNLDDQMDNQVVMAALALAEQVRTDKQQLWEDYQKLQRENMEMAGRLGFYQAKLQDLEDQVLALSAGPTPTHESPRAPWWKRWLGLQPA